MGLSRNKVAVSEGAAGSPPFYGERKPSVQRNESEEERRREKEGKGKSSKESLKEIVVQFPETNGDKSGGVAQLGEHLPCKQGVKGSNPFISTTAKKGEGPSRQELG